MKDTVDTADGWLRRNFMTKEMISNLLIVNVSCICNNIPVATPSYGVYLSELIRYSRACGSYQDFLDRGVAVNKETTEPKVPIG